MKLHYGIILLLMTLALSGCFVSERQHQSTVEQLNSLDTKNEQLNKRVEDIESQIVNLTAGLGEYKYFALDPKISFSFSHVEFLKPESKYGSPRVKYSVDLLQTNDSFPLNTYTVNATLAVFDSLDNEVKTIFMSSDVVNGIDAVAENQSIYGLEAKNLTGYKLKVKSYIWFSSKVFHPTEKQNQ